MLGPVVRPRWNSHTNAAHHNLRVTVGYRKTGGKWLVTHEHVSMPIDMKTGKAPTDLKP